MGVIPKDFRRTCATGMARLGTPRFVQARVLGHIDSSITSVYDRFEYLDQKRVALDAWARKVYSLIENKPAAGAVLAFQRDAAHVSLQIGNVVDRTNELYSGHATLRDGSA